MCKYCIFNMDWTFEDLLRSHWTILLYIHNACIPQVVDNANSHYHIHTLIIFEVVEETNEVGMAKSRPESQLPWHELLLVVARRSNAVDYLHGGQLEVSSRVECFFHLHVARYCYINMIIRN